MCFLFVTGGSRSKLKVVPLQVFSEKGVGAIGFSRAGDLVLSMALNIPQVGVVHAQVGLFGLMGF